LTQPEAIEAIHFGYALAGGNLVVAFGEKNTAVDATEPGAVISRPVDRPCDNLATSAVIEEVLKPDE
jgi:hypothetical protein